MRTKCKGVLVLLGISGGIFSHGVMAKNDLASLSDPAVVCEVVVIESQKIVKAQNCKRV
jgi:hypothetical protein